jgi:hypothetical protein
MKNKKGIEISINFLVIIIVSIVVFVMGLFLINKIMGFVGDTAEGIDEDTRKEIERLVGPDEVVSIPYHKKSVRVGDEAYFGIGIYSKLNGEKTFNVNVSFDAAYLENNTQIGNNKQYMNNNWNPFFKGPGRNYSLIRNDKEIVDVKLIVDSNTGQVPTPKGIYIFNVNITYFESSAGPQKIYKDHIYKLYLSVE